MVILMIFFLKPFIDDLGHLLLLLLLQDHILLLFLFFSAGIAIWLRLLLTLHLPLFRSLFFSFLLMLALSWKQLQWAWLRLSARQWTVNQRTKIDGTRVACKNERFNPSPTQ